MISPVPLAAIPQPDPLPLPGAPSLLHGLLLLTFFLHVIPMNLVLGGAVIGAVARLRGGPHPPALARFVAKALPTAIAATITFGIAPLLFLQVLYGRVFFVSSILMAWFWLGVVPALVLAYALGYRQALAPVPGRGGRVAAWAIVLLFAAIAFAYSSNMSLMLRPERFVESYNAEPRGLHLSLQGGALVPRYLHMVLSALAVAGLAVAVHGLLRRWTDPAYGAWAVRHGSLWFCVATILNVATGMWWLVALPREVLLRFMGQDLAATGALVIGASAGLGALGAMAGALYARDPKRLLQAGVAGTLLALAAMVIVRDRVRVGFLEQAGFEPLSWVEPQWGAIALFALALAAGLATIGWMVVVLARAHNAPPA